MLTALLAPAPLLRPVDAPARLAFGWHLMGVLGWCGLLVGVVLGLNAAFPGRWPLTPAAFSNWDAEHYLYIRLHGYDEMRAAFFPLFPFWWRLLSVSPVVMGLLNLLLFAGSFAALAWQFQWSWRAQAIVLVVPSLMFMALPYSEAVFFAAGTVLLLGLHRQSAGLYCLGLLLSCMCRAAAFVMLPAVAAVVLLSPPRRQPVGIAVAAAVSALLGLGISMLVHYRYTGHPFAVFAAQRFWGNHLQWPTLPLRNWGGDFATRFEAPSLLVGLGSAAALGWLAWRQWRRPLAAAPATVFALAYVGGVTLITLATRGGVLVSLSRYVYATPYFLLLLADCTDKVRLSNRQLAVIFGLMEVAWLVLFGAYTHIRSVLWFSLVSAGVLLWLLNAHRHPSVRRLALVPTVLVGTGLMLYLLLRFLAHEWVA
jgi:hypothetical protein